MMTKIIEGHFPLRLSDEAARRLEVLATFLETKVLPPDEEGSHFDMGHYVTMRGFISPTDINQSILEGQVDYCATSACAAGWAAVIHKDLGLTVPIYTVQSCTRLNDDGTPREFIRVSWDTWRGMLSEGDEALNDWIFSGEWSSYDNTHIGAAKRIRYALKYGVPNVTRTEARRMYWRQT